MLWFTYTYHDAINKLTDECALKLQDYEVGEGKWEIVRQLQNILKVYNYKSHACLCISQVIQSFKLVTLQLSTDTSCPAAVIPAMDHMHEELTTAANSPTVMPALCTVLGIEKEITQQVLETQAWDDLVLYPCYKLKYFEKQEWDLGWVKTAKNIVKEEFCCLYANYMIKKPSALQHKALSKKVFCSESFCLFFNSDFSRSRE